MPYSQAWVRQSQHAKCVKSIVPSMLPRALYSGYYKSGASSLLCLLIWLMFNFCFIAEISINALYSFNTQIESIWWVFCWMKKLNAHNEQEMYNTELMMISMQWHSRRCCIMFAVIALQLYQYRYSNIVYSQFRNVMLWIFLELLGLLCNITISHTGKLNFQCIWCNTILE
jgi:hypothetical protein